MNASDRPHVVWHEHNISRTMREARLGQRGCVIWFTGLSGCGKSTVANALDAMLYESGATTYLLDGDNIRHGLCAGPDLLRPEHGDDFAKRFGLGFGAMDREENIRRIGCVAELFAASGMITLTAFVSPYRRDRQMVRDRFSGSQDGPAFIEVFMDTPIEICEQRDPKGLYKKARAGEIPNFTGISDPYEPPESPEIHLRGESQLEPADYAKQVMAYLKDREIFPMAGTET